MSRQGFAKRTTLSRLTLTPVFVGMAVLILFFASPGRIHSQLPPGGGGKSPQAILVEMKAANADLLKKQQATLDRIDELQKQADQLRIFCSQH